MQLQGKMTISAVVIIIVLRCLFIQAAHSAAEQSEASMLSCKAATWHMPLLQGFRGKWKFYEEKLDQTIGKLRRRCWTVSLLVCRPSLLFARQVQCAPAFQHQDAIETRKDTIPVASTFCRPINSPLDSRMSNLPTYAFAFLLPISTWARPSTVVRVDRPSASCGKPKKCLGSLCIIPPRLPQSDYPDLQLQVH